MKTKRLIKYILIIVILIGAAGAKLITGKIQKDKELDEQSKKDYAIPVNVSTVSRKTINTSFKITGTFEPYRELILVSETQGKITGLYIQTGTHVSYGSIVAEVDKDIMTYQMQVAEANLNKAKKDLDRFSELLAQDGATPMQHENVVLAYETAKSTYLTTKKNLENTTIRSPLPGTITKKYVERGSYIMPGSPIADITDINHLKFIVTLTESEAFGVKVNQKISLSADQYKDNFYTGNISSVGIKADNSRRYPVEILLSNSKEFPLKAGMTGKAYFQGESYEALVIPRSSLIGSSLEPKVYVVKNDRVQLREIRIGRTSGDMIEIEQGLDVGEKVVTSGQINLEDGTVVNAMEER